MTKGYLCLVLHAHLPYVRHPETKAALEERWLYEALTETYIPLIRVLNGLLRDNIDFDLTISLSPTLMEMLKDPLLIERYLAHLHKSLVLADRELDRTAGDPHFHYLARVYQEHLKGIYHTFHVTYRDNLLQAFRRLMASGRVELITCSATHGYLPLIGIRSEAVEAQVALAVETFHTHIGRPLQGMWLPECGYYHGLERVLAKYGINYFFTDTHGLLFGEPRPRYGIYAPIRCPGTQVAVFGRDVESSLQVWSADEGYPGDPDYREFYRDIGYDLEWDYIKDFVHPDGFRVDTGFKYYRITGRRTNHKEPYQPDWARSKAAIHAGNFMFNREKQIEFLAAHMDRPPIVVAPYDAELFGHWWFEGPMWLDFLFRKIHFDQDTFKTITPSQYLKKYPRIQPSTPCPSSWGAEGYNDVWLEGSNDWIYRHLHQASKDLAMLARNNPNAGGVLREALNQAAREVLLAESSDWAFIMKTGTMVEYACRRTVNHLGRFRHLYTSIAKGNIHPAYLKDVQEKDNIFPDLDYRIYAK